MEVIIKRRGRPLGFKLSDKTKTAISLSKIGQRHREETKDKISKSLIAYFRRRKPLSDEIINTYCRISDDSMCSWALSVKSTLDDSEDIKTYRSMLNAEIYERTFVEDIDTISHSLTPELILLFKEYCEMKGITVDEGYDSL